MKVYLAGEMHTDWRSELRAQLMDRAGQTQVDFLLPHITPDRDGDGSGTSDWYVVRDLLCLRECDLVFALVNDVGRNVGTSAEIGYACALGKPIILCRLDQRHCYDFLEKLATSTFSSLQAAVECLAHAAAVNAFDRSSVEAAQRAAEGAGATG